MTGKRAKQRCGHPQERCAHPQPLSSPSSHQPLSSSSSSTYYRQPSQPHPRQAQHHTNTSLARGGDRWEGGSRSGGAGGGEERDPLLLLVGTHADQGHVSASDAHLAGKSAALHLCSAFIELSCHDCRRAERALEMVAAELCSRAIQRETILLLASEEQAKRCQSDVGSTTPNCSYGQTVGVRGVRRWVEEG